MQPSSNRTTCLFLSFILEKDPDCELLFKYFKGVAQRLEKCAYLRSRRVLDERTHTTLMSVAIANSRLA